MVAALENLVFRHRVAILMEVMSKSPKQVAEDHNLAVGTIYRWRKDMRKANGS